MPKTSREFGATADGDLAPESFGIDEISGLESYRFADRVKERFQSIVGEIPGKPKLEREHQGIFHDVHPGDYFTGQMPTVIRRLTLDQLSALYSLFDNWYRYLSYQTNLIAAERSEALRQKEFLWSRVRQQFRIGPDGKKNNAQNQSDLARKDYRFVKANAHYEELNSLYACLVAALEVANQDMKVISREVTIHQAKMEAEYLGSNFKNRFHQPFNGSFRMAQPEISQEEPDDETEEDTEDEQPKRFVRPRMSRA